MRLLESLLSGGALDNGSRRGNDHVNWKFNNARGGHDGTETVSLALWVGWEHVFIVE